MKQVRLPPASQTEMLRGLISCHSGKLSRAKRGFLALADSQEVSLFIDAKPRSKTYWKGHCR